MEFGDMKMISFKVISVSVFIALVQSGMSMPYAYQDDIRTKREKSEELRLQVSVLLNEGKYHDVIEVCLQLIDVNKGLANWYEGSGYYYQYRTMGYPELASAYLAIREPEKAMGVYRELAFWDRGARDFYSDLAVFDSFLRYAVLLAERNRVDDAKAIYYAALRHFAPRAETVPFRAVFDLDVEGDSWSYSEKRLKAAVKMMLAMRDRDVSVAQEASELWPEWNYPYLFLAQYEKDESLRSPLFDKALALSRSEEERQMIRQVAGRLAEGTVEVPSGKDVRKKMKVLEDWRKKAEVNRGSYASG